MAIEKTVAIAKQTSRLMNLLKLTKDQLENLILAYETKDVELANKIRGNDLNINIEFHYIIDKSTWILTQHTVLGEDLRMLLTYNNMAKEFERFGDVIAGFAKHLTKGEFGLLSNKNIILEMKFILDQLDELGDTITNSSEVRIVKNSKIIKEHANLYKNSKINYIKHIAISSNFEEVETYVKELRLVIRITRLCDYILNSYEYLIYALTGKHFDFDFGDDN